jgi:hypothetical protein
MVKIFPTMGPSGMTTGAASAATSIQNSRLNRPRMAARAIRPVVDVEALLSLTPSSPSLELRSNT